ncbi:MAG: SAVED domain-containing protein [Verrucomicrobia bacterium]|jgi:hypothetical protein|nr:SAVED domain-containing protein [Verrucomicrobiota bacterium]
MPKQDATRHIPERVRYMLWGRAAGRCEFDGCNRALYRSPVTQEQVNIAEAAHIWAFSPGGARGNEDVPPECLNSTDNLLLACHDCHKLMDEDKAGEKYSVELLQGWKRDHESRVEVVTEISPDKRSHVLMYGANVGQHSPVLNHNDCAAALFPRHYPGDSRGIELSLRNSSQRDDGDLFWQMECQELMTKFEQRVSVPISTGSIGHLSVFALAPQPLLILLGTLLTDIASVDVYQRHREPGASWHWPEGDQGDLEYVLTPPGDTRGPVALVLSLTAPVARDRITQVLGEDVALWHVTAPEPSQDILKSREQLSGYRAFMRGVIRQIEAVHGTDETLHVFPVMGVAFAVELGRVRQPKANQSWQLYDQADPKTGFAPVILIGREEDDATE